MTTREEMAVMFAAEIRKEKLNHLMAAVTEEDMRAASFTDGEVASEAVMMADALLEVLNEE